MIRNRVRSCLFAVCFAVAFVWPPVGACASDHVSGNVVHYDQTVDYAVSGLQYLGSFKSAPTGTYAYSKLKTYLTDVVNEVYGRVDARSGRLDELFIAQWETFPVTLASQGTIDSRTYDFRVPRFLGLQDFLKGKGIAFADLYRGGFFEGSNKVKTRTKFYYAVAADTIPEGVAADAYLHERFAASIAPVTKQ